MFAFSCSANAAYVWSFGDKTGSSPGAVCASVLPAYQTKVIYKTDAEYICQYLSPAGNWTSVGSVSRTGTPDPPPPEMCSDKNPWVMKFAMKAGGSFPNHIGSCMIVVDEVLICRKETVSGVSTDICMLQVRKTGEKWSPSSEDPKNPGLPDSSAEDKSAPKISIPPTVADSKSKNCPTGSVQGGVDSSGIPICIGTGSTPPSSEGMPETSTKPPVTVTNSDGSKTTTTTTTTKNSDGSTSTVNTVVTVAPDGTVTKTGDVTVSKTPSGAAGKKDSENPDLCKSNPTLSICRNSSVTGTCESISCDGDAIQCATLRAAATLQCRDKEDREGLDKSTLVATGDGVIRGNDSARAQGEALWKGTSVDLSNPNLDQSGFLGGGSCFPNKSFTVSGRTVEMNFTTVCANIQPIRYAMVLIGFILAYMIISKSILQS